ncbi:MAG: PilW family protein [Gammaproteobacteria bacterium]|nr:PilW family protein [Gammaproteobacteria bacterium]
MNARPARGHTLIELLLALTLGAGLIGTVLTLYAQGRSALRTADALAQLAEQARYAFATLEADVQMAGYYGLTAQGNDFRFLQAGDPAGASSAAALRQGLPALAALNPAAQACGLQFALDLATPLQAANNGYAAGIAASAACAARPAAVPLADTLTVRRAATPVVAAQTGRLQLLVDRSEPARRFVLADGTLPPGTLLASGVLELHDLETRLYYVATEADGNPDQPALRVKSLTRIAGRPGFLDTEVMAGIEDLQVELAIDGGYVAPDALPPAGVVRGVRLWLRVRAALAESPGTDTRTWRYADVSYTPAGSARRYRRQVFSHVIALRNAPA